MAFFFCTELLWKRVLFLWIKVSKSQKEIVASSNTSRNQRKKNPDFCPKGLKWVESMKQRQIITLFRGYLKCLHFFLIWFILDTWHLEHINQEKIVVFPEEIKNKKICFWNLLTYMNEGFIFVGRRSGCQITLSSAMFGSAPCCSSTLTTWMDLTVTAKGSSIYYIITFSDIFDPSPLCKHK